MSAQQIVIIFTAAIAALLEIIDSSIVNVAIPTMMGNLGVTQDEISWVSTGYMIANSIVLPIAAWLGQNLGRKNYFTGAILTFTFASFACGMAPNLTCLIFFRIFQGLAGGALLPTSQTLIQEQFPREKAGMAMAIFGMSVMIGPALGPTIGGYLTDNFGWRSIFNVNVPLGLMAAVMSFLNVGDAQRTPQEILAANTAVKRGIDWTGLALLVLGVGCAQYVLERGQAENWFEANSIRTCAVLAVLGLSAFVYWELKVPNPIMNLRLFKLNAVSMGTLMMMSLGVMVYALTFEVPIFASTVIHLTATQTGILFMPGSILTMFAMLFVGKSMTKISPKLFVLVGMSLGEASLFVLSHFTSSTGADELYWPLILRSVATGFLFIPINGMILSQFQGESLGQVAGMMNFFRQMGGSIGIASLDVIMTRFSAQNYNELLRHANALNPMAYRTYMQNQGLQAAKMSQQVGMGFSNNVAVKSLYGRVMNQVFVLCFDKLCIVLMGMFALGLIPLALVKVKKITKPVMDTH